MSTDRDLCSCAIERAYKLDPLPVLLLPNNKTHASVKPTTGIRLTTMQVFVPINYLHLHFKQLGVKCSVYGRLT